MVCRRITCTSKPSLCSYFISLESNFVCHAFLELSYVCRHLFFTHLLSATLTVYYLCTHFAHTLTIVFLCIGISDSKELLLKKKREKSLLSKLRIGVTRLNVLKDTVSVDGDSKTNTVVDNIIRHTPPSQVLALTSRCHMSLPVAIGV